MPSSYPTCFRERVLAAYDRGLQTHEVAALFGVSRSWARRLKQRRRETGHIDPRKRIRKKLVFKIDRRCLENLVADHPDATLAELRDRLAEHGIACSISGIDAALRSMNLSFKKRRSRRRNKIDQTLRNGERTGSRVPAP